jgi:ABC-2 type transport system ATP-binding protein
VQAGLSGDRTRNFAMSGEVLRVEGLTKRYGTFAAVNDLSFTVAKGEIVGFLGQNGAGKSTTIKILCNLVRPTAGEVWLNGKPIVGRVSGEHRRRMGVIVEAPRFYPHLSGRRNLRLLARIHGVGDERVDALLQEVGLSDRQGERFGRFSMGMKQRLGLAAVLLNDPSLIVLDEPTTGLDPVGRQQIHDLIAALTRERKVSVLLCSHILAEVEALCHRALVMHQGKLVLDQSLKRKSGIAKVERTFREIASELTAKGEVG